MARRRKPVPARLAHGDRKPVLVRRAAPREVAPTRLDAADVSAPASPPRSASPMLGLRHVHRQMIALQARTAELVDEARAAGHSYAEIGQALGITRQAARQRHLRG